MNTPRRPVAVAVAALALVAAGAPAAAAPRRPAFPYWPAKARPGHPVPLKDGAAFRAVLRHVVPAAKKAGWVRIAWDQAKDGGAVTLRYGRPEPDHREVTVHLAWKPAAGRGTLTYRLHQRAAPVMVHGFPLCPREDVVGKVSMTGQGRRHRAVLHCRSGGYHDDGDWQRPTGFPTLYGWTYQGDFGPGFLFSRDGEFVEVWTERPKQDPAPLNELRYLGSRDPRRPR